MSSFRGIAAFLIVALATAAVPLGRAIAEGDEPPTAEENAESTAPPPEDISEEHPEKPTAIEEMQVTGRRTTETTFESPISISAFGTEELERRNIRSLADLTAAVPNLKFDTTAGSSNTGRIFVRGVGQHEGFINFDPKIAVYIDEVLHARALGSNLDLLDVERIEVLPGAQASLFGKNAIGGSIFVYTKKPQPEYGARIFAEAANYHGFKTALTINAPTTLGGLEERLFSRFSFQAATSDGIVDDTGLGERVWDDKNLLFRGALRYLPTEDLELLLTYQQSREYEKTPRGHCQFSAENPRSFLRNGFDPFTGDPVILPPIQDVLESPEGIAQLGGSFGEECRRSSRTDTTRANTDFRPVSELDSYLGSLAITWDTPDVPLLGSLEVKSTTAWIRHDRDINFDLDNSSFPILSTEVRGLRASQWSHESRISGLALEDRFHWVLGGFFMSEAAQGDPTETNFFAPSIFNELSIAGVLGFANPLMSVQIFDETKSSNLTYAGYAQGSFDVTEELTITVGARRVSERRDMDKANLILVEDLDAQTGLPAFGSSAYARLELAAKNSKRFGAWTGVANFSYALAENVNLFGGVARGFSSGGYNPLNLEGGEGPVDDRTPARINQFDPEKMWANEIGLKTRWLDDRLSAEVAYFHQRWDDMQQRLQKADANTGDGSQSAVVNTGNGTIQGLELKITALPIPALLVNANLGLVEGKYRSFQALNEGRTAAAGKPVFDDLGGNELQQTPPYNINLNASYTIPLGEGELTLFGQFFMQGAVEHHIRNFESLRQNEYGSFDARVAYRFNEDRTEVAFWARNIADRRYLTAAFRFAHWEALYFGEPRRVGVSLTHEFGDY